MASLGSASDLYPFVAIGREMRKRQHDVFLVARAEFAPIIEKAGIRHISYAVPVIDPSKFVLDERQAFTTSRLLRGTGMSVKRVPKVYDELVAHLVPGETIVVASSFSFAAHLVHESHQVPTAIIHLSPIFFRSPETPLRMAQWSLPAWLPRRIHDWSFRLMDELVYDRLFCKDDLNLFRAKLGLPPIKRIFDQWMHSGDLVVGLFPDWFAPPQSSWPNNVRLVDFPLQDGGDQLSNEAEAFLDAGEAPVVFFASTVARHERAFYQASVDACRMAGFRGILLARHSAQIPKDLPQTVRHFEYLPFSRLLPRSAAFVHYGGIGSASHGLASGVPQIVTPRGSDQFDNAHHLKQLGVARTISRKKYTPRRIVRAVEEMTRSSVREVCRMHKAKFSNADPITKACDTILDHFGIQPNPELRAVR